MMPSVTRFKKKNKVPVLNLSFKEDGLGKIHKQETFHFLSNARSKLREQHNYI